MGSNLSEPDGTLGDRILDYYEARARGGAALLLVGSVGVSWPRGATNPRQVALSRDDFVPGMQELARRAHRHGARVALQLHHGGRNAVNDIAAGRPLFVPSAPRFRGANDKALAFTSEEAVAAADMRAGREPQAPAAGQRDIDALVEDFAAAALRARQAGIDGVEVHAAHGYAIAGFLSPAWNFRDDAYGGTPSARARLMLEVLQGIRARVGDDYPVWVRIDACEYRVPRGLRLEDALRNARFAAEAGADAIHVSAYSDGTSGIGFTEGPLVDTECGYVEFAAAVKRQVSVPVIAVGRIEPLEAAALIERGDADFVAMGRQLLADPELPRKLTEGREHERRPCIHCYRCVGEVCVGRSLYCAVNPQTGHEKARLIEKADRPRRVVVLGGGPAGMEAARTAALRGHRVTLLERLTRLGGQAAVSAEFHTPNARLIAWLEAALRQHGVELRLGCEAGRREVESLQPEVVVVATGRAGRARGLHGADEAVPLLELGAWRRADRAAAHIGARAGRRFVVLGGDLVGVEVACWLSEGGGRVTIAAEEETLAAHMALPRRWRSLHLLRERDVRIVTQVARLEWRDGELRMTTSAGRRERAAADLLVDTRRPAADADADGLIAGLRELCPKVVAIGDRAGGQSIDEAVLDGFRCGTAI